MTARPFTVERKRRGMSAPVDLAIYRSGKAHDAGQLHGAPNWTEIIDTLDAIEEKVARMRPPSSHAPDAFHEDKSEIKRAVRRLREEIRLGVRSAPAAS